MDRRSHIRGTREQRTLPAQIDTKTQGNSLKFTGYASVFDAPYDVYGGPSNGRGWSEIVDKRAFDRTLQGSPDLHLLINHEGLPLARTKSGTLKLSTDERGLYVEADLDRRDPDVQRIEPKMERGDMDEMSFGFRTIRDDWTNNDETRRLTEVSLDHGDVSIVNFGANPATSAELNFAQAIDFIARMDEPEFAHEVRSMSRDDLQRVVTLLDNGLRADKEPYGDVDYADPGYQDDGQKRYPLDSEEHVRAAWSYINQAHNASMYTAEQVSEIKSRIMAAGKKYGIKFDEQNSAIKLYERANAKLTAGSGKLSLAEARALMDAA